MIGIDVSRWQGKDFNVNIGQFCIMKASEGATYKDPLLDTFYARIAGNSSGKPAIDKCYGFYHYARPENNSPEEEVNNFLSLVSHHAGNAVFALDWEGKALGCPVSWAQEWLFSVYAKTGVRPMIYTSAAYVKKFAQFETWGFPLWVAHYGVDKPKFTGFGSYAIWQFTSSPFDIDIFPGDENHWKTMCRKS